MKIKAFLVFILSLTVCSYVFAEDLVSLSDRFNKGLAKTIESNMANADACVKGVEKYFQVNADMVKKIRELSKEPMKQAMQMAEKYKNIDSAQMSEEELAAMEKEAMKLKDSAKSSITEGTRRYNEAINKFSQKYPMHAMKIAKILMKLLPTDE